MANGSFFQDWFAGKRWYKLVHVKAAFPLTLADRMAYSLLVYRAKVGGATLYEVARATRLSLGKTLPQVKARLIGHGLAVADGRRVVAQPPPTPEWFGWKRAGIDWRNRFGYVPVCHTPAGWTPRQVAIYFTLLSQADGLRVSDWSKQAGIAALLGVDRSTVARTVKKLETLGLLDGNYLRSPPADVIAAFPDAKRRATKEWNVIRACGWPFATMPDGPDLDIWVRKTTATMLRAGFDRDDVLKFLACLYEASAARRGKLYEFLTLAFPAMLQRVCEETEGNRARGKYQAANGLGLLVLRTKEYFGRQTGPVVMLDVRQATKPPPPAAPGPEQITSTRSAEPGTCPSPMKDPAPADDRPPFDIEFVETENWKDYLHG